MGFIITVLALVVLLSFVFPSKEISDENFNIILLNYIPRVSLVVFLEIFAYFFLRLYKQNLAEIKLYQNELTTVEMKFAAVSTAIHFGEKSDISAAIAEFLKTERNFILKKEETTVDIEKSRIENEKLSEMLKSVTEMGSHQEVMLLKKNE